MSNPYIEEERHIEVEGISTPITDEALMEELEGFSERLFKFGKYLQKNTTVTPDRVFDNKGDKVFDVIFCKIAKKHGISSEEVRESLRTTTGIMLAWDMELKIDFYSAFAMGRDEPMLEDFILYMYAGMIQAEVQIEDY